MRHSIKLLALLFYFVIFAGCSHNQLLDEKTTYVSLDDTISKIDGQLSYLVVDSNIQLYKKGICVCVIEAQTPTEIKKEVGQYSISQRLAAEVMCYDQPKHVEQLPNNFVSLDLIYEWNCRMTYMNYRVAYGRLEFYELLPDILLSYDIKDDSVFVIYQEKYYIERNILENAVHFYDPTRVNVVPDGFVSIQKLEENIGDRFVFEFSDVLALVRIRYVGEIYSTYANDESFLVEWEGELYVNWEMLAPEFEKHGIFVHFGSENDVETLPINSNVSNNPSMGFADGSILGD